MIDDGRCLLFLIKAIRNHSHKDQNLNQYHWTEYYWIKKEYQIHDVEDVFEGDKLVINRYYSYYFTSNFQ